MDNYRIAVTRSSNPNVTELLPERDPRVDPLPGDVLRKGQSTVTVCMVEDQGFGFSFKGQAKDMPPMPTWDKPWRGPWRRWAKGAEVIERG